MERGLTGADPIPVTWGRPLVPVAGSPLAAVGSHRFRPLPGMDATREADLVSGQAADLHAVYGGLRSGRLIIAGPPGAGKTGAAVLLVLAALRYRREVPPGQRPDVPVPVLFTAQDWNPHRQPAAEWLTGKLQATYPFFVGDKRVAAAAALVASGRITVILDGLDEISPDLRPVALQALSRQATFRLVLLSRTSEIADAATAQGILEGAAAIELNSVDPVEAASYLQRTQLDPPASGWQELTQRICANPVSPLSQALNSPLTITLVRDTYHGQDIRELLEFCDTAMDGMPAGLAVEAITGHLLDRVLPAAYAPTPGQPLPPYDLATAHRALTAIAAQMNKDGTRDLNWWQIPTWAPLAPRTLVAGLVAGLVVGLVGGLGGGPEPGLVGGLVAGLVGVLVAGGAGAGQERLVTIGDFRLSKALSGRSLVFGLGVGLVGVLVDGLLSGLRTGLAAGLGVGFMGWFLVGFEDAFAAGFDTHNSLDPVSSRHSSRNYGLVFGLGVGLMFGLVVGLPVGLADGLPVGLVFGLVVGLMFGLLVGLRRSQTWALSLVSVQLVIKWGTRIRLAKFLNDALDRNVLRAVGPAYQFRHARLQDRLAAAAVPGDSAQASHDLDAPVPVGEADET